MAATSIPWIILGLAFLAYTDFRYLLINALNNADANFLIVLLLVAVYWHTHQK